MHVQGRRDLRLGSRIRRRQKQNRMHIPFSGVSYSYVCLPVLLALSFREPRTSHGLERNMCHYFAQGGADSMRAPNLTVLSVRNGGLTWAMSQTAHELRPFVSCNPAAMIRCPKISKGFSVIAVIRGSFCLQAEALRVQNGGCMCRMVSRAKCVCF